MQKPSALESLGPSSHPTLASYLLCDLGKATHLSDPQFSHQQNETTDSSPPALVVGRSERTAHLYGVHTGPSTQQGFVCPENEPSSAATAAVLAGQTRVLGVTRAGHWLGAGAWSTGFEGRDLRDLVLILSLGSCGTQGYQL